MGSEERPGAAAEEPGEDRGRTLGPCRLHPAEIALAALDNLREALVTVVIALVVGAGSGGLGRELAVVVALGAVGFALVAGYLRWRSTSYHVTGGALHYRAGVFSPDETTVPLVRVQAIDTTQGPVQRLFGVHELHVQTAGGGAEGEIVLRAVSDAAAHELRAVAGLEEARVAGLPEWRLGGRGLLVTALTAPQFGVVLPVVGAAVALADDLLNAAGPRLADELPTGVGGIALLVGAAALAAWVLSFLGAIIAFAGFTVVSDGERLRIRRGLLSRRAASVPLASVHGIEVVESPLRRPFGLAAVRLRTAGYSREPSTARTLLPAVALADAERVLATLVPPLAGPLGPLERPPPRSRRRYALPGVVVGAAAGAGATVAWTQAWPAIPALAALAALEGVGRYAAAGWRLDETRVVTRRRRVARRTLVARRDRLQSHDVSQSPPQRRARLATLGLAVGKGRAGGVAHLEEATALRLFDRLRATE